MFLFFFRFFFHTQARAVSSLQWRPLGETSSDRMICDDIKETLALVSLDAKGEEAEDAEYEMPPGPSLHIPAAARRDATNFFFFCFFLLLLLSLKAFRPLAQVALLGGSLPELE